MKRRLVLGTAVLSLALAACGGSKAAQNTQVNQDSNQAIAVVNGCLAKGGDLKTVEGCVAPRGHGDAFVRCTLNQLHPNELSTKAGEHTYFQAVYLCGEQNR